MWALLGALGAQALSDAQLLGLRDEVQRYVAADLEALPLRTPPRRQQKVDHLVVLYMENHAADSLFGCMGLEGFEGVLNHSILKDPEALGE